MSFPFNFNIPAAGNNPSDDQPDMLQNNQSSNSMWNVDHVSYNNNAGGKHKQVTFNTQNVAGAQVDPESIIYTNNVSQSLPNVSGNASSNSQLFFRNQDEIFPLNFIRAAALFTTVGNVSTPVINNLNGFNISSISSVLGTYTVTLDTNAIIGNSAHVFIYNNVGGSTLRTVQYTLTNPDIVFSLSASTGNACSVIVYQF